MTDKSNSCPKTHRERKNNNTESCCFLRTVNENESFTFRNFFDYVNRLKYLKTPYICFVEILFDKNKTDIHLIQMICSGHCVSHLSWATFLEKLSIAA